MPVEVLPEPHLRRTLADATKHPDGLVVCRDKGFSLWLEVESARKSGRNLENLDRAVIGASRSKPATYYDEIHDVPVKRGMLAIAATSHDERGYRIDHWARFQSKLRAIGGLKSPVSIVYCKNDKYSDEIYRECSSETFHQRFYFGQQLTPFHPNEAAPEVLGMLPQDLNAVQFRAVRR